MSASGRNCAERRVSGSQTEPFAQPDTPETASDVATTIVREVIAIDFAPWTTRPPASPVQELDFAYPTVQASAERVTSGPRNDADVVTRKDKIHAALSLLKRRTRTWDEYWTGQRV